MSDHEYFEQLCAVSVDGTLTDSERQKLEAHLAECPSCAALKQDLERMQELFAADVGLPESLHDDIMRGLEQQELLRVVRPEKPVRRMPVFTMLSAAAVVVIVVLGGGIGRIFSMGGGFSAADSAASASSADSADAGTAEAADVPAEDSDLAAQIERAADKAADAAGAADHNGTEMDGASYSADNQTSEGDADGSVQPAAAGAAPAPAETDESAYIEIQGGETAYILLPDSLKGTSVAHCYLARGTGELPDLEGELLMDGDGVSYFSLPNSMNTIENTLAAVEQAGYEVTAYDDVGLTVDNKAGSWLLIVVQE